MVVSSHYSMEHLALMIDRPLQALVAGDGRIVQTVEDFNRKTMPLFHQTLVSKDGHQATGGRPYERSPKGYIEIRGEVIPSRLTPALRKEFTPALFTAIFDFTRNHIDMEKSCENPRVRKWCKHDIVVGLYDGDSRPYTRGDFANTDLRTSKMVLIVPDDQPGERATSKLIDTKAYKVALATIMHDEQVRGFKLVNEPTFDDVLGCYVLPSVEGGSAQLRLATSSKPIASEYQEIPIGLPW
ncbi:hypothetical protein CONLIGDRAFT_679632 [Coniochaeta ligniaria NRRL 30616]|uniref:Uncharacterized protein n=1 Tax=Coniochaeta ligniaria NRRL 30616 TaxID=1408157 RepID=A0A1J7IU84_9PEZI|nr:hypothetical protein CONLIGDRAFT_679632 [Coniochaeta ligniaria NRRL 30616]